MNSLLELKLSRGTIIAEAAGECRWWKVYDVAGTYQGYALSLAEAVDWPRPLTEDDETVLAMHALATL